MENCPVETHRFLSYFLEMSRLLHLLSTFNILLRHSLRRMPPRMPPLGQSHSHGSTLSVGDFNKRQAKPLEEQRGQSRGQQLPR